MKRTAVGILGILCAVGTWVEGEIRDPAAIRKLCLEAIRKITDFALIPAKVLCPPPCGSLRRTRARSESGAAA